MRVYLPATLPRLAVWLDAGAASLDDAGAGQLGFAVTPTLRESYREADVDELEHVAQLAAATNAIELLAADPTAPRRRVVIAVDVDDAALTPVPDRGDAAVLLDQPVSRKRWGSALVDDPAAESVVTAAIAAEAQAAIEAAEGHDLGWYAVQELRYLLD